MPTVQYSDERLPKHKLFISCIRRCLVSLHATEWCRRYLPCYLFTVFHPGLLFFHVGQPGDTAAYLVYPISDIGRCENLGRFDSNGKMETRHPVEGSFGSEFPAICNHCGVTAAWSRKTLKFCEKFLHFFEKKRPLWYNFHNSVPKVFTVLTMDVVVLKFGRREIVRYLPNKKFRRISLPLQTCLYLAPRFRNISYFLPT